MNLVVLNYQNSRIRGLRLFVVFLLMIQIFFWDLMNHYIQDLPVVLSCLILFISMSISRIHIHKKFLWITLYLAILGVINILLGNLMLESFVKQFFGIFVCVLSAYWALVGIDIKSLMPVYVNLSVLVSLLGVLQRILFEIGISWPFVLGLDYEMRVTSIFGEPSYLGTVICPAIYLGLEAFINKRNPFKIHLWKTIVMIAACALTMSTVSYAVLLIAIVICYRNKKNFFKKVIFLVAVIIIIGWIYYNVEGVKERIDSFVFLFAGDNSTIAKGVSRGNIHGSSGVWMVNLNLAIQSFKNTLGFGSGLGSHVTTSARYVAYNVNAEDACSLFLRLLSEVGWIGLLAFGVFIKKFYVSSNNRFMPDGNLVSNFVLVEFSARLIRQGNYFWAGMGTFMCFYFYNWLQSKQKEKSQAIETR